jgi:hypothetical protein
MTLRSEMYFCVLKSSSGSGRGVLATRRALSTSRAMLKDPGRETAEQEISEGAKKKCAGAVRDGVRLKRATDSDCFCSCVCSSMMMMKKKFSGGRPTDDRRDCDGPPRFCSVPFMASTSTSNVTVNVSPSPGFCIKSKSLQPGALDVPSVHERAQGPVPLPQGIKVFVNVTWSKDVPPPLDGVEKALDFAARSRRMDLKSERDSPIYVFVSDGRPDADKGTSTAQMHLWAVRDPWACTGRSSVARPTQRALR